MSPTMLLGLLPLLTFAGLLVAVARRRAWLEAIVPATLIWTLLAVASLEILSLLGAIRWLPVTVFWIAAGAGSIAMAWLVRKPASHPAGAPVSPVMPGWNALQLSAFVIVTVALITGLIAVPNTVDSLRYHLPRIEQWIQQGSLSNFPTSDLRQLASNPLAEMLILHFRLLSESDRFDNVVQGLAFAGSAIAASTVAGLLGGSPRSRIFATILVVTMPMAILQGTSTQNDLVLAFFLLAAAELFLRWHASGQSHHAMACAAAVGLAFLTKGSAVFFALPFGLVALYVILRKPHRKALTAGVAMVVIIAAINGPHLYRNAGLILTPGSLVSITASENHGLAAVASSLLRNIASNFVTPFARVNQSMTDGVAYLHAMAGMDVNDPETTLKGTRFHDLPRNILNGDAVTNPLQILLILASCTLLGMSWVRRKQEHTAPLYYYFFSVLSGGILFCAMLRWQPFIVRLQLPFFILIMPAVAVILTRHVREKFLLPVAAFLVTAAVPFLLFNQERPLYGNPVHPFANHFAPNILSADPWMIIFWDNPRRNDAFQSAIRQVGERRFGGVGLIVQNDYPFWRALKGDRFRDSVYIENVCLRPDLAKIYGYRASQFRPAVVLTDLPQPKILRCANGIFEQEAVFATGDTGDTMNISVYRRYEGVGPSH